MNEINEPFIGDFACQNCHHRWTVCLPEGLAVAHKLECPKCKQMEGSLTPDFKTISPPPINQDKCDAPMIKSTCGCFDCSTFCLCACHKTPSIEDVVDAFEIIDNKVREHKIVTATDVKNLFLDDAGLDKLAKYFEKNSYYPIKTGVSYDAVRGAS